MIAQVVSLTKNEVQKMKRKSILSAVWMLLFSIGILFAEEEATVTPASEAAEGLDLQAVSELFKDSENLEAFEKSLNDPENGVNNLDLDENGEVDFVRVVEEVDDDAHVVILQACLGEDEFQDVATIEIEKSDEDYNMQVTGNEELYGADYYVEPTVVHIHTWPVIRWIYRPAYKPYWSRYYFGFYPKWWRVRRPVVRHVYRNRAVVYTKRAGFRFTRTPRVVVRKRVKYHPHSSTLVKRKVVHTPRGTKVITKKKQPGKPPVVKKKTVRKRR
jgi:hypothetical protein